MSYPEIELAIKAIQDGAIVDCTAVEESNARATRVEAVRSRVVALTDMTPAGMWVRYLLKKQEPRTLENMQAESAKAQISQGELNQGLGEMWQQGYPREGEGG